MKLVNSLFDLTYTVIDRLQQNKNLIVGIFLREQEAKQPSSPVDALEFASEESLANPLPMEAKDDEKANRKASRTESELFRQEFDALVVKVCELVHSRTLIVFGVRSIVSLNVLII